MYNGIGLVTPRGSGTNGFVQRNLSHIPNKPKKEKLVDFKEMAPPPAIKRKSKDIIIHEKKREIEIKCLELQDKLEEEGKKEEEIQKKVSELRERLMEKIKDLIEDDSKEEDNEQLQSLKEIENKKVMEAFGINKQDYIEGASFNQELQELKKQERINERRKREEEREERRKKEEKKRRREEKEREREREKERERRHKERKHEERRHEEKKHEERHKKRRHH